MPPNKPPKTSKQSLLLSNKKETTLYTSATGLTNPKSERGHYLKNMNLAIIKGLKVSATFDMEIFDFAKF